MSGISLAAFGQGGFTTPLQIGSLTEIKDEFGITLIGSAAAPGDLVQVLSAESGTILPPATDGSPDSDNPVLVETGIGAMAPSNLSDPGIFGISITGDTRPGTGDKLFVRVFNAPDLPGASFYQDSQLFTVNGNDPFLVILSATDQPLDSADDDSDGLHNSYEKSLGTDKSVPDSDGDGMKDGDEFRAGTDGTDAGSLFAISGLIPSGSGLTVYWDTVPGKDYVLEYTTDPLDAVAPVYIELTEVLTATADQLSVLLEDGPPDEGGHYRVRLVEP